MSLSCASCSTSPTISVATSEEVGKSYLLPAQFCLLINFNFKSGILPLPYLSLAYLNVRAKML
ncbi:uncharacterized protein DS421_14g456130 [Arachis hypogaea]|nr:uncharacterized protein DS421_14g456130 [Arachis hypogaea]